MSSSKEKQMEQEISEMKEQIKQLQIDMAHIEKFARSPEEQKIYAIRTGTDWYNQLQTD